MSTNNVQALLQKESITALGPTALGPAALGIDIGGTKIKSSLISCSGSSLLEFVTDSRAAEGGPNEVRSAVKDVLSYFRSQGAQPSVIGVGCAGSVDAKRGMVRNSPNFKDWDQVPLGSWIEEDSDLETFVDNDANCALFGEWRVGKAIGKQNVVLLTLGTGIGGGLILNGAIYRGTTGTAGELGHMSIHADGIRCPCGNRGCFERYCSASALKERFPQFSCKEIFTFAKEKRTEFQTVVDDFLSHLMIGLTSIANVFDPEVILLGGAVSSGVVDYIEKIQIFVRDNAFPAVGSSARIELTEFSNLSGAIGAGLMAIDEHRRKKE